MAKTRTMEREDWDALNRIEQRVSQYVPGRYHWTARQDVADCDDLFGIAIGKGACHIRLSEAKGEVSDARIRELATEILGYPPDSLQDLQARYEVTKHNRIQAGDELDELTKEFNRLSKLEDELIEKIALAAQHPGGG
jgi:hypothetical protein